MAKAPRTPRPAGTAFLTDVANEAADRVERELATPGSPTREAVVRAGEQVAAAATAFLVNRATGLPVATGYGLALGAAELARGGGGADMTTEATGPGDRDASPEQIRAEMADTRAAMGQKLAALTNMVLGSGTPDRHDEGGSPVAKAKAKAGPKKAGAKKPAAKKVGAAKKAKPAKAAASRTKAKAGGTKAKAGAAKVKAKPAAKKGGAAKKQSGGGRKSTTSKVLRRVKEAAGDILSGAAIGAMQGAAAAVATEAQQVANQADQVANNPPTGGGTSGGGTSSGG